MLINPREFGKKLRPEFVEVTAGNISAVSGAMVQHCLVRAIREALLEHGMSEIDLAEAAGMNYQRLTRVLRGAVLMRMEDIGMIARTIPGVMDLVSEPEWQRRSSDP